MPHTMLYRVVRLQFRLQILSRRSTPHGKTGVVVEGRWNAVEVKPPSVRPQADTRPDAKVSIAVMIATALSRTR
jgi:hypothetical protein